MKNTKRVQQIRKIIALDPAMETILLAELPLEEKRLLINSYLSNVLLNIYDNTRAGPAGVGHLPGCGLGAAQHAQYPE